MKLELKNIKVNLTFSEETTMFQADIYANGKKIGYASNDGHGGSSDYNAYEGQREALREAEKFAQTLPSIFYQFGDKKNEIKMNLEHWIDTQIEAYVTAKETAKLEKKLEKKMETKVIVKRANGNHTEFGFNSKMKIKDMPQHLIEKMVSAAKASLGEGDVILNKNI